MVVAIYSRGLDADQGNPLEMLLEELFQHEIGVLLYEPLMHFFSLPESLVNKLAFFKDYQELISANVDCLIGLGGDGTILDSVTIVKDSNIPILGINFGRMGFLASISKEELSSAVEALVSGTYIVDRRSLIHVDGSSPIFEDAPFALNEFAIHKRDTSSMIRIHTYLNGEFLNTYWADGLIVATPTGSTGYSMSCNGPILFPESSSLVITPVAPHNLNMRPIVIADTSVISFEVEGRSDEFICVLDSRRAVVDMKLQLAVQKENFSVNLIRLSENSFLSTLRNKLTWGLDTRN